MRRRSGFNSTASAFTPGAQTRNCTPPPSRTVAPWDMRQAVNYGSPSIAALRNQERDWTLRENFVEGKNHAAVTLPRRNRLACEYVLKACVPGLLGKHNRGVSPHVADWFPV